MYYLLLGDRYCGSLDILSGKVLYDKLFLSRKNQVPGLDIVHNFYFYSESSVSRTASWKYQHLSFVINIADNKAGDQFAFYCSGNSVQPDIIIQAFFPDFGYSVIVE